MKIPKWQHKLVRDYKRGKLVSYFLNNAAKTCLYELKISENIDIEHVFQSKPFFHLSSNLHTSFLSVFSKDEVCPKHFILTLNRGPGPFCFRGNFIFKCSYRGRSPMPNRIITRLNCCFCRSTLPVALY